MKNIMNHLKSIIIPDSVEEIGGAAFDGCSSLESVVIPDSVKDVVDTCRLNLIEAVAETSEDLMDKYFGGEEFTEEEAPDAMLNLGASVSDGVIPADFPLHAGLFFAPIITDELSLSKYIDFPPTTLDHRQPSSVASFVIFLDTIGADAAAIIATIKSTIIISIKEKPLNLLI